MLYLDFLQRVHELAAPASYLEIGIRNGDSLGLGTSPAVGIDPDPDIQSELTNDVTVFRGTSDEYFAAGTIEKDLPAGTVDLAFIDGMHWFEYALRDFMNVEEHSAPHSVVVLDDVLPRSQAEAAREMKTVDWTGDVWKIIPTLVRYRPDLTLFRVATQPTGLLVVIGLDRTNRELSANYDQILDEFRGADVPPEILNRDDGVGPQELLEADFWADLRAKAGLPASAVTWTPRRPLDAAEIEATKQSPYRDMMIKPSGLAGALRRTRRRVRRNLEKLGARAGS